MYRKRRVIVFGILLVCMSLTACSQIGLSRKGSYKKEEVYTVKEDNRYKLGDEIERRLPIAKDTKDIGCKYIIKSAKVYATPKEAGITEEQVIKVDDEKALKLNENVTIEKIMESPILILETEITNVNLSDPNVSMFTLFEKNNANEIEFIAPPCYHSAGEHRIGSGVDHYYHFELAPGETKEITIGYYLGAGKYQLENLLLTDNARGEDEYTNYVELGLQGEVQ